MFELSADAYLWVTALHVISAISWMAGLLYLPRLFVYHTQVETGSEASETFKIMERRLLKAIMNPAAIVSVLLGVLLVVNMGTEALDQGWLQWKLLCTLGLLALHGFMIRWQLDFAEDRNSRSEKFYRFMNEGPTVLMIAIVILVIVKPF